jgi:hypothetical protein
MAAPAAYRPQIAISPMQRMVAAPKPFALETRPAPPVYKPGAPPATPIQMRPAPAVYRPTPVAAPAPALPTVQRFAWPVPPAIQLMKRKAKSAPKVSRKQRKWKKHKKTVNEFATEVQSTVRSNQEVHYPSSPESDYNSSQDEMLTAIHEYQEEKKKIDTQKNVIGFMGECDIKNSYIADSVEYVDLNEFKMNCPGLDFIRDDDTKPFVQSKLHLWSVDSYKGDLKKSSAAALGFAEFLFSKKKGAPEMRHKLDKKGKAWKNAPINALMKLANDESRRDEKGEDLDDAVGIIHAGMTYPIDSGCKKIPKEHKHLVEYRSHDKEWYDKVMHGSAYRVQKEKDEDGSDGEYFL